MTTTARRRWHGNHNMTSGLVRALEAGRQEAPYHERRSAAAWSLGGPQVHAFFPNQGSGPQVQVHHVFRVKSQATRFSGSCFRSTSTTFIESIVSPTPPNFQYSAIDDRKYKGRWLGLVTAWAMHARWAPLASLAPLQMDKRGGLRSLCLLHRCRAGRFANAKSKNVRVDSLTHSQTSILGSGAVYLLTCSHQDSTKKS